MLVRKELKDRAHRISTSFYKVCPAAVVEPYRNVHSHTAEPAAALAGEERPAIVVAAAGLLPYFSM